MIQIEKLRKAMNLISAEKGEFVLFGLFLTDESPERWDLVVSAPWLEEGKLEALREFVKMLSSTVEQEEISSLSKIVTLNHDDPSLKAILKAVQVENGPVILQDNNLFGLEIKQAYILRAKRLNKSAPKAIKAG
jgi:hypothetical protein